MKTTARSKISGLCLSIVATTTAIADDATTYPVPAGVDDAASVELPGSTRQDYFSWTVDFPATPALPHYEKVFANWTPCGKADTWWRVAPERHGAPNHFIHKFERQWISPANDKAVSMLFQYLSIGTEPKLLPTNSTQMVSLVTTNVENATAHFEAIGITCGSITAKSR